jgi:hypothetical protein
MKFNFKSGLLGFIIGGILFGSTSLVMAENKTIEAFYNNIKLIVNGNEITMDTEPCIIGGRTFVPARFVAEALGASVSWDETNNSVIVTSNSPSSLSSTTTKGVTSTLMSTTTNTTTVNNYNVIEKDGIKYIDAGDVNKECQKYNFLFGYNTKYMKGNIIYSEIKIPDTLQDISIYKIDKIFMNVSIPYYCVNYDYFQNTIIPFLESHK